MYGDSLLAYKNCLYTFEALIFTFTSPCVVCVLSVYLSVSVCQFVRLSLN